MKCSIDGCEGVAVGRGWCNKHYCRWRSTGDPLQIGKRGPKLGSKSSAPPKHGRSRYWKHGCRCDICEVAELSYRNRATCVDCGIPCQRSGPKGDWQPPAESRCRSCAELTRPPKRCRCGTKIARESKSCLRCLRAEQARWHETDPHPRRLPSIERLAEFELAGILELFLMLNLLVDLNDHRVQH